MEILEGVEIPAPDAAALGKQEGEFSRPGTEGIGLFQQHGMSGEGFPECPAERHGIALRAGPFAEIVICRENLSVGHRRKCSDRLGVTPA